jgi:CRISPR-associated protein Cmx8
VAKSKPPETITIIYDLFELPTAQHKAGLAGLLLQIDSMRNRKKLAPKYRWDETEPNTKVHVEFTEKTTSGLFDDLYNATWVEGAPRKKPLFKGKGKSRTQIPEARRAPITERDENGNEKVVDGYVYLEVTPALDTLRQYLPKDGEWARLWRDLIWQVIRDSTKKAPYNQRAATNARPAGATIHDGSEEESSVGEGDGKGTADGSTWADLVKYDSARKKNTLVVGGLSSALLLGAQAKSAEELPFVGRIDQNLLLHFWPITSMVYVPRFVDRAGDSYIGRRDRKDKTKHFCLAIPDVADLPRFLEEYPKVLSGLSPEVGAYRPREALIDLPAEGGISFVGHLARLTPQVAGQIETRRSVSGIDYLHLNQDGNIVRFLSTGRIPYTPYLAEDYLAIVGRPSESSPYRNPLFRRGLILALLENQAWFRPFGRLLTERDAKFFVNSADPPENLSWFWVDARKKLQEVIRNMQTASDPRDTETMDAVLAELIYRLVRQYLNERAKQKSGIDPEDFKAGDNIKWENVPPDYVEARRGVGESLFLEFRSRHDQAFVEHFAATFFAVKQYLSAHQYSEIGLALFRRSDDVKTLTLLALSANS